MYSELLERSTDWYFLISRVTARSRNLKTKPVYEFLLAYHHQQNRLDPFHYWNMPDKDPF